MLMMKGLRRWSTETLVVLGCCIALTMSAFEAEAGLVDPENRVMTFLSKCGYLSAVDSGSEGNISAEKMSDALTKFQTRMGIDVTGILDAETFSLMSLPGCGDTVIDGSNPRSRPKRNPLPDPCVHIPNGPIVC